MKMNWMFVKLTAFTALILFGVSNARAQYGACAPACDVPVESCGPSYSEPTCDAPTCGAPSYGVECDACEASCGCGGCCLDSCGLLAGVVDLATCPFRWIVCSFTDGIFPDCGCAPRPPKSNCDPCDVCGNYVGGCDDYSDACGCNSCNGGYAQNNAYGNYSTEIYDSEEYDSSPTRMSNANSEYMPEMARNNYGVVRPNRAELNRLQRMSAQAQVGTAKGVRSVNYERNVRKAQEVAPMNSFDKRAMATSAPQKKQSRRDSRNLQNKQNVRVVAENVERMGESGQKTFGRTRPIR